MRLFIVFLFVFSLLGCETIGKNIKEEDLSGIDTVGVVSLLGDFVSYSQVGFTAFGNKNYFYEFDGLEVDQYITSLTSDALKRSNPRVNVVPLYADFNEYKKFYKNPEDLKFLDVNGFVESLYQKNMSIGVRYFVIVSRYESQIDPIAFSANGFGFRNRRGSDYAQVFVLLKFQLIDAVSKKELSRHVIFEKDLYGDFRWVGSFDDLSDSEKSYFKKSFFNVLDKSIRNIAAALIQSPKDFEHCSKVVYSEGFDADGVIYYKRDDVVGAIRAYTYNRIVRENVHHNLSYPPYYKDFNDYENHVLDCIYDLVN